MIRVVVADDQALMRSGLIGVLAAHDDVEVVGEAADGVQAVELAERLRPDLVVMDIRMPRMDGIQATRRLRASVPAMQVLVLTTFDLDEYVWQALRAGASGFLLKDAAPDRLVHALRVVAAGEAMLAPTVTRRLVERYVSRPAAGAAQPMVADLTPREREVLDLMAEGRSNQAIAERLFVTPRAVEKHVTSIFGKLRLPAAPEDHRRVLAVLAILRS